MRYYLSSAGTISIIALVWLATVALPTTAAAQAGGEQCGPNVCGEGTVCCNYGCGICTPPEGACILLFCEWGRPSWIDASHTPGADVYDHLTATTSLATQSFEASGLPETSVTGVVAAVRAQHYFFENTALRLMASTTNLIDDEAAPEGETFGFTVGGGGSYRLPVIADIVSWAFLLDLEHKRGPDLANTLAPIVLTDGAITSFGGGVGLADLWNAGPLTATIRYVHSFIESSDDIGFFEGALGVSTDLRWIQSLGGPNIPIGLRVGYRFSQELTGGEYRSHEIGGGLYGFIGEELRVGADVIVHFVDLADAIDSTRLVVALRLDWYWDSNF